MRVSLPLPPLPPTDRRPVPAFAAPGVSSAGSATTATSGLRCCSAVVSAASRCMSRACGGEDWVGREGELTRGCSGWWSASASSGGSSAVQAGSHPHAQCLLAGAGGWCLAGHPAARWRRAGCRQGQQQGWQAGGRSGGQQRRLGERQRGSHFPQLVRTHPATAAGAPSWRALTRRPRCLRRPTGCARVRAGSRHAPRWRPAPAPG